MYFNTFLCMHELVYKIPDKQCLCVNVYAYQEMIQLREDSWKEKAILIKEKDKLHDKLNELQPRLKQVKPCCFMYAHMYIHYHVCMYICVCAHMYIHYHVCIYVRVYIHMYIRMYIHIHAYILSVSFKCPIKWQQYVHILNCITLNVYSVCCVMQHICICTYVCAYHICSSKIPWSSLLYLCHLFKNTYS